MHKMSTPRREAARLPSGPGPLNVSPQLMLLVRRFRGSAKGAVWYSGPLLKLLDIPGHKQLEQILVKAVERSER